MDLPQLRAGWEHREFLFQLRYGQAFGRLDLPELRAGREYRELLLQLRNGQTG